MRRLAVAVTVATALVVTVMVQGQGKIDPAIKTAPAWEAAFNAKDAAKIAALYAEDAVAAPT
jgi:ketosteroid isomerase-like protein